MYHNTTRKKVESRQNSRNIQSSDISDFPREKKHREFLMWDENLGKYTLSGKDSVTTEQLNAMKDSILGADNFQGKLDTLQEISALLGNPDNTANDLITRINTQQAELDKISINLNGDNINLNAIATQFIGDSQITNDKLGSKQVTAGKIADETITTLNIGTSQINTRTLLNDAVTDVKLGPNAVAPRNMKAKSILNVALDDNSVDGRAIADDSIGMNHLNDFLIKNVHLSGRDANQGNGAAITNDKIVAGTIDTDSLKDSLIVTSKLDTGSVTHDKIQQHTILHSDISDNAITQRTIANGAVVSSKILDGQVKTINIEDGAVTKEKIDHEAVTSNKIADLNVTRIKIQDTAVNYDKIDISGIRNYNLEDRVVNWKKIDISGIRTENIADQNITNNKLAVNSVNTNNLFNNAVTTYKIDASGVWTNNIKSSAITTRTLNNQSITTEKLGLSSVTTDQILNGTITNLDIGDDQILNNHIATGAVKSAQIDGQTIKHYHISNDDNDGEAGVRRYNIEDAAIDNSKLDNNSITAGKIVDGEIITDKLNNNAVTFEKIGHDSIDHINLRDNCVWTIDISDSAITSQKIANGAVTAGKIANGVIQSHHLGPNCITVQHIQNLNVTGEDLSNNSIRASTKLIDGSITSNKIGLLQINGTHIEANSIDGNKIKNADITSTQLADDSIITAKIVNANVTGEKIAEDTIPAGKLKNNSIITSNITNRNVTGEKIAENAITHFEIDISSIKIDNMASNSIGNNQIVNNSIIAKDKLVANSITSNEIDISGVHSEEIASKAVINRTIGDAAITLDKLDNDIHRKLNYFSIPTTYVKNMGNHVNLLDISNNKGDIQQIQLDINGKFSAPNDLNTLQQLAAAINNNANFHNTIDISLNDKLDLSGNAKTIHTEVTFKNDIIGDLSGTSLFAKQLAPVNGAHIKIGNTTFKGNENIVLTPADCGLTVNSTDASDNMVITGAERDKINNLGTSIMNVLQTSEGINSFAGATLTIVNDISQNVTGIKTFQHMCHFDGGITGNLTGNSNTTDKLKTPINIAGNSFDGSNDININATDIFDISGVGSGEIISIAERTKLLDLSNCTFENVKAVGGIMTAKYDAAYDASCSIVFNSDSNITCVNPITANLTGIADYANELSTTKTIGGVPFNGTADIVPKSFNFTEVSETNNQFYPLCFAPPGSNNDYDGAIFINQNKLSWNPSTSTLKTEFLEATSIINNTLPKTLNRTVVDDDSNYQIDGETAGTELNFVKGYTYIFSFENATKRDNFKFSTDFANTNEYTTDVTTSDDGGFFKSIVVPTDQNFGGPLYYYNSNDSNYTSTTINITIIEGTLIATKLENFNYFGFDPSRNIIDADLNVKIGGAQGGKTRMWMNKFNGEESVYLDPSSVGLTVIDITNANDCKVISEVERTNFQFLYDNLVKLKTFSTSGDNEPLSESYNILLTLSLVLLSTTINLIGFLQNSTL